MPSEHFFTGDLRERDFSGQELSGAIFAGADLYRANFAGCKLESAVFVDCFAAEANFSQADCALLQARKSSFYRANFRCATLNEALLWDCVLAGADLRGAEMRRLTLTLDCNSFEDAQLDRTASAELAYLFGRARSPHRAGWMDVAGEDVARLDRVFAR